MKLTYNCIILATVLLLPISLLSQHPCLLAQYKLDGNAKNSIGVNKDGINNGAVATKDRFGNLNSAMHFDGKSSRIDIPVDSFLLKEYTYSVWVKTDSFPLIGQFNKTILSIGGYGGDQALHLGYQNGGYRNGYNFNPYGASTSTNIPFENAVPRFNVWEHVTVTVDYNFVKIYVNCKIVDSLPMKYYPFYGSGSPKFTIGCRFSKIWYYPGDIDDVRIYNCALNRSEILSEFCNSQPSTLVAWKDTVSCSAFSLPYELKCTPGFSTYKWYDSAAPNKIIGTTNIVKVVPSSSTTYIVETNTGKKSKVRVQIVNNPLKDLGLDTILCVGQSLILDNPSGLGTWDDGSKTQFRTVASSGTYSITYSQSSCTFSDTIYVDFRSGVDFSILGDTLLCDGEATDLFPDVDTLNYQWFWSDGITFAQRKVKNSGTYSLNLKDSICNSTASIRIVNLNSPKVMFTIPNLICDGDVISLNAHNLQSKYKWSTGSFDSSIIVKTDGEYFVNVTNKCGSDSARINLKFETCKCPVYVPTVFTPDGNNRNESLVISSECEIIDYELRVYNRWGEEIFKSNKISENWNGKYLDADVPEGVYIFLLSGKVMSNGNLKRISEKGAVHLLR